MSKALPGSGILAKMGLGGYFGPKENVTVQTAATSAGGLGILFVSAVPAMYRLNLLSPDPKSDFGRLIALTVACAYFGVFFVIPLRTYFIIRQRLVFPTPTATAFTIRSLHSGPHGELVAKKKSKALAGSLFFCFAYKILNGYLPGIFLDWHIGWTLYQLGWSEAIKLENFGWIIEFTPAFFGAGILSGLNASWSFFMGSVLAWGIIAPSIVKTGQATGVVIDESVPKYISYYSMRFTTDESGTRNAPSPRYWLLWPGVLMMLVFSFFEIGMSSRHAFWTALKSTRGAGGAFKRIFAKRDPNAVRDENDPDPSPLEDRIKTWWWVSGVIVSIIISCALMATQFSVGVGETILALLLGFIFSFIGVQSAGDTDINPVSTCAKASQLVFGGVSKGQGLGTNQAQLMNLVAGSLAAGAAAQATDMTGDLKTGHLLRAKPKNQFAAQLFGTTIAIFLSAGLFVLFTKASPCIITGDLPCPYGAPSISAWAAVAFAVTAPSLPIPASSGWTAIALAIVTAVSVVAKHLWLPRKYWVWFPNWNAVGLAFVVPQLQYSIAMAFGSLFAYIWAKKAPKNYDMYGFAISAGMLAGEGLGGVMQALLNVAGVMGEGYGLAVGCPLNQFCG
ncbi:related to permeases-unknown function [Serendipita indica DSM 11827]|uniref:Oligopeptide transporter n=1 Tax=Serendipita indica (strain DSM 11827) TaxID=1109443 RepID=G4TYU4_SERID|nr:related to permeases-unknown function [Serendipita indica DSM 11827]